MSSSIDFRYLGSVKEINYVGEIDENGKACGVGQTIDHNGNEMYHGTYYNNRIQGLGE